MIEPLGVAVWFMDDGYKYDCGYYIATDCFDYNELLYVKDVFKTKFNIDISITKQNRIHIRAK